MDIEARITRSLAAIEAENGVRILYACESGSRAWGFASADSDYDVRFLYAHPRDWYVSVATPRDVIERPITDDLDINGWELRKALRLLRKSHPVLLEWLHSPIIYRRDDGFLSDMRDMARACHRPAACFHHDLHMAQGNRREYRSGPHRLAQEIPLRPAAAASLPLDRSGPGHSTRRVRSSGRGHGRGSAPAARHRGFGCRQARRR